MIIETIKNPDGERCRIQLDSQNIEHMQDALGWGMAVASGIAAYIIAKECQRGLNLRTPHEFCTIQALVTQFVENEMKQMSKE